MENLSLEEIAKLVLEAAQRPFHALESGSAAIESRFGSGKSFLSIAKSIARQRQKIVKAIGIDKYLLGRKKGLYREDLHHGAALLLFLHDWIDNGHRFVLEVLRSGTTVKSAIKVFKYTIKKLYSITRRGDFALVIGELNAASTPLAMRILSSIASYFRSVPRDELHSHLGTRINVTATLGAGKTTFVFWSCVAALRAAGFTMDEAIKATSSLFVRDLEQLIEYLRECGKLATNNMFVPFLVLDDAVALGLSKYEMSPAFGDPKTARIIARLNNALTIAREGLGALIIIGHVGMLPRPLREHNVDMFIAGVSLPRPSGGVSTIWVASTPGSSRSKPDPSYMAVDMTATLVPPMLMPMNVYLELETIKLDRRLTLLEELEKLIEEIKKEIKGDGRRNQWL